MNPLAAIDETSPLLASKLKIPTVIFIPGAFHTPAHFGPLSRYLETQGCENFCLSLPSIGDKARTGKAGLAEDVAAIRGVLEELVWDEKGGDGKKPGEYGQRDPGGKNVILVMHSSGAIPGCQAVTNFERSRRIEEGKRGGVVSLVLVGGLLVDEGESLESTILAMGEDLLLEYSGVEGNILQPVDVGPVFFNDLTPDKAVYWECQLEPQSASVHSTAVRSTCWNLDIPITYVSCTKDPQARVRDAMVAKMKKANWSIKTIEAGHTPFLSCVEELGDIIMRAGRIQSRIIKCLVGFETLVSAIANDCMPLTRRRIEKRMYDSRPDLRRAMKSAMHSKANKATLNAYKSAKEALESTLGPAKWVADRKGAHVEFHPSP